VSIIVGIDCSDCVILAASGPAPKPPGSGAGTIEPPTELRAIAGRAIIGFSGAEELAREVAAALERYMAERDPHELTPEAHRSEIQAVLSQPLRLATAMTRALKGLAGGGVPEEAQIAGEMIVALPGKGRHGLYVVDEETTVAQVKDGGSFAVIGPAKLAAESFLRFLQRLLWREGKPTRAAGQCAAYWTVRHVTDVEGGSTRSVRLVRLSPGTGKAADIVWYGERVIASLRRAVDAGMDEIRSELKRRVLIDFEDLEVKATSSVERPVPKRVPEVRVTLRPPQNEERKPKW
jgi:hypothetical protein